MKKSYEVMFMPDGANIEYSISGSGPQIILIHGSEKVDNQLNSIVEELSQNCTVFYILRRGWGGIDGSSSPKGKDYSIEQECDDVIAIMKKHNIDIVFGYEYGAIIALHILLKHPIKKVLLLEPYLASKRPLKWLLKLEHQVQKGEYYDALATFIKGNGKNIKWVPKFVISFVLKHSSLSVGHRKQVVYSVTEEKNKIKQDMETSEWKQMKKIFGELPTEIYASKKSEKNLDNLKLVKTSALFMYDNNWHEDYIEDSIVYLSSLIEGSKKVAIYFADEKPVSRKNGQEINIIDAILGFIREG